MLKSFENSKKNFCKTVSFSQMLKAQSLKFLTLLIQPGSKKNVSCECSEIVGNLLGKQGNDQGNKIDLES